MNTQRMSARMSVVVGIALIVLGALFLAGQFLRFDLWHYLWPLVILAVGALFFAGMLTGEKDAAWLALPGSIISMIGLILLYQNTFQRWGSWAYAWTLIMPTAIGIGLYLAGRQLPNPQVQTVGRIMALVGAAMFLALGALTEVTLMLFGRRTPDGLLWSALLILFGIYLLARPFVHRSTGERQLEIKR